jgi:hypothetical protein
MMEEWKIVEALNDLDEDGFSEDDKITVLGIEFTYSEESSLHSSDVSATLSSGDFHFEREGRKEVSYDRWVDTNWYDWE